jgi:uncharacterized Zn-binding protein involved in type VI secretion
VGKPCAVTGATMTCSFGMAPSTLIALPISRVIIEGRPAADITDIAPGMNVPPFGMCTSLANPTVAAATAAALGTLTPMPCIPAVVAPWTPQAPQTLIAGKPALVAGAVCTCAFGGVINLTVAGAVRTTAS